MITRVKIFNQKYIENAIFGRDRKIFFGRGQKIKSAYFWP